MLNLLNRLSLFAIAFSPSTPLLSFSQKPVTVFQPLQTRLRLFCWCFRFSYLLLFSFASLSLILRSPCFVLTSSLSPAQKALFFVFMMASLFIVINGLFFGKKPRARWNLIGLLRPTSHCFCGHCLPFHYMQKAGDEYHQVVVKPARWGQGVWAVCILNSNIQPIQSPVLSGRTARTLYEVWKSCWRGWRHHRLRFGHLDVESWVGILLCEMTLHADVIQQWKIRLELSLKTYY